MFTRLTKRSKKKPRYISSELRLTERFQKGNHHLYPIYVNDTEDHHYAIFTEEEISRALKRGAENVEDSVPKTEYWVTKIIKLVLL